MQVQHMKNSLSHRQFFFFFSLHVQHICRTVKLADSNEIRYSMCILKYKYRTSLQTSISLISLQLLNKIYWTHITVLPYCRLEAYSKTLFKIGNQQLLFKSGKVRYKTTDVFLHVYGILQNIVIIIKMILN